MAATAEGSDRLLYHARRLTLRTRLNLVVAALSAAFSALDRAAKKGAIHTGKADRSQRRLAALVAKAS